MSTSPVNMNTPSAAAANSSANAQSSSAASASSQAAMDALGNPDTFLQLLVAQLQYQDPESPADGTTFVTQLATFAGVEEQSAMRGDLDSINTVAQKYSATLTSPTSATSASTAPDTTAGSNGAGGTTDNTTTGAQGTSGTSGGNSGASN